ncbi:hypothetical protein Tco_1156130 [Tanacetum coccineum]
MSSNSDDIQAAGSDTRPPMLDRTDYESWSQRIRLYCRGKENGLLILQKASVPRVTKWTRRKNDTMSDVRGNPILSSRITPKISTSSSITTLKAKATLG